MTIRFVDQTTGEEVPTDEVGDRLAQSIRELRDRLAEAEGFRARWQAGAVGQGDRFLDFSGPLEHGFDRTGPSEVVAEEEE